MWKSVLLIADCVSDQLSRLHMILKPFMLRRIKKDVENELSDKVEELILPSMCWKSKSEPSVLAINNINTPLPSA